MLYSQMVMELFGWEPPSFPGSGLIPPVLGSVIFWWGGWSFLSGGFDELRQRRPGMMLLVAMAISDAERVTSPGVETPDARRAAGRGRRAVALNAQLLRRIDVRPS